MMYSVTVGESARLGEVMDGNRVACGMLNESIWIRCNGSIKQQSCCEFENPSIKSLVRKGNWRLPCE
jgi:hypothetical protein